MALASLISGPYSGTWNSTDVGQQEDGFRLRQQVNKQTVRSNSYGDSAIDAVYRGGDCFLIFTGIEFLVMKAVMWPYGAFGVMGQVGRLDVGSSIAQAAVLTAVSGTTAYAASGAVATLTATQSIVDENLNAEMAFASRLRVVPVTMRLYPYTSSSNTVWFTVT